MLASPLPKSINYTHTIYTFPRLLEFEGYFCLYIIWYIRTKNHLIATILVKNPL